jgi:type I restriction enzyme S subunit
LFLYSDIEEKETKLNDTFPDALKKSILQSAIQGKLVAQNPDDEPATVLLETIRKEKEQLIKSGKLKRDKNESFIYKNAADNSYYESRNGKVLCIDDEIPFEIPDNWAWCRLGKIIAYAENIDIQKHLPSDTLINYVDIDAIDNQNQTIREIKKKTVKELSTRARRVLKAGYIAYSTVRPYLNNIVIIQEDKENFIGSTGLNVFRTVNVELKYLFYFLLTPHINVLYKGMMIGFNSPTISNEEFEATLIPIPPLNEQLRVIEKINQLFALLS